MNCTHPNMKVVNKAHTCDLCKYVRHTLASPDGAVRAWAWRDYGGNYKVLPGVSYDDALHWHLSPGLLVRVELREVTEDSERT